MKHHTTRLNLEEFEAAGCRMPGELTRDFVD
jgi:hypothetical protein